MASVRLLQIIFVILILVTLGELGYYAYIQFYVRPGNEKETKISSQQNRTLEINPTIIQETIDKPIQMAVKSTDELALDSKTLERLINSSKYIKRDVLKSYVITAELEGEITKLDIINQEQLNRYKGIPNFILVIKGPNGGYHQMVMQQESTMQTSIISIIRKQGGTLTVDDLKVGDKIRIKVEMDITKSGLGKSFYKWLITKL